MSRIICLAEQLLVAASETRGFKVEFKQMNQKRKKLQFLINFQEIVNMSK